MRPSLIAAQTSRAPPCPCYSSRRLGGGGSRAQSPRQQRRPAQVCARGGERRPGGGSGAGGHSARRAEPPERLLSAAPPPAPASQQPPARPDTVYTVRLSTGLQRGSALSDPAAGVLVCLVAQDGAALLHRIPRLNDPELTEQEVRDICSSIDEREAGANCGLALHHAASRRQAGAGPRLRFQEGAVDEVSFRAPELGPLAALMVAPEAGRWACDEVDVSSSRTGHTDRFVCREALGEGGTEPAAYLQPVPPGAVVYGSGDAAVVVTKEQAAALYSLNMRQYGQLKAQLVAATAVLVGLGSALAYAAGGRDLALPFALGGASGVLYQYMLQMAVDNVGAGGGYGDEQVQPSGGGGAAARQLAANPAARAGLVAAFAALLLQAVHLASGGGGGGEAAPSAPQLFQVQQIVAALAGFLCYKAALVGVALVPPPPGEERSLLQRADATSGGGSGGRARRADGSLD